jgi:hypothetical protein
MFRPVIALLLAGGARSMDQSPAVGARVQVHGMQRS